MKTSDKPMTVREGLFVKALVMVADFDCVEEPKKAFEANPRGHTWYREANGDIELIFFDESYTDEDGEDYHQGYQCAVCGQSFCSICFPDGPYTDCPGDGERKS